MATFFNGDDMHFKYNDQYDSSDIVLDKLRTLIGGSCENRIPDEIHELRCFWDTWHYNKNGGYTDDIDKFKFYLFVIYYIMITKMNIAGKKTFRIYNLNLDTCSMAFDELPNNACDILDNEKLYLSMIYVLEYIEFNTEYGIEEIPFKLLHSMEDIIYPFALSCYGNSDDALYREYETKFNELIFQDSDHIF